MIAGKIIYALLSADSTLTTLLGASSSTSGMKKIYPMIAPQKESAPFVVYSQITEEPDHCAQGMSVRNVYMQIDAWAATPDAVYAIAERIITALDGHAGTVATYNVDNILLESQQDVVETDLDPPLYGRQIEFLIRVLI